MPGLLERKNVSNNDEQGVSTSNNEFIRLRVFSNTVNREIQFRTKTATPLSILKRYYTHHFGTGLNLNFSFNGHIIMDTDTPKSLNMVNFDLIHASPLLQNLDG